MFEKNKKSQAVINLSARYRAALRLTNSEGPQGPKSEFALYGLPWRFLIELAVKPNPLPSPGVIRKLRASCAHIYTIVYYCASQPQYHRHGTDQQRAL